MVFQNIAALLLVCVVPSFSPVEFTAPNYAAPAVHETERHLFLGIEIAAGLILFSIGWLLLIGGIQRCGDAVDVVLDGNRNGWRRVGFWFCAAAGGAGLASSVVTYALSLYLAR